MSEALDKSFDKYYGLKPDHPKEKTTDQRLANLEHDARQPRLATETNVPSYIKTRKCTKDAAADRVNHGDSCSAKKVDPDPMCITSFGEDSTEPPALPCRDDAVVNKGAAALKSCLSPVKIRTIIATGGLLPADAASTTTRTIFHQPPPCF